MLRFHLCQNLIGEGGIYKSHAAALESCSAEASAIDSIRLSHDLIKGDQFRTATLIVLNQTTSALKNQFPIAGDTLSLSLSSFFCTRIRPLRIVKFCDNKPELPLSMLPEEAEGSRFLEGQQKHHDRKLRHTQPERNLLRRIIGRR